MPSVLNQLQSSTLSLPGNRLVANPNSPSWGYPDINGSLDPALSSLQNTYSVDGFPYVRLEDFNRAAFGGVTWVTPPSRLDELDTNAPNNTQAGLGGVVSQVYKSSSGRRYKDLGPQPGRY